MPKKKPFVAINLPRHSAACHICKHPRREDIELDYVHCIPWAVISQRYEGVLDPSLHRHALAFQLDKKRNRKSFYWNLIEKVPMEKITVENALEAAKQLDRIERVIVDNPTPSNIQVVYSFGQPQGDKATQEVPNAGTGHRDGSNRIRSVTNPAPLPPVTEEISPL